jgi:alpha,alpha-trehalase
MNPFNTHISFYLVRRIVLKYGVMALFLIFPVRLAAQISPAKQYGNLFVQVQMTHIFDDSKTFADCIALKPPDVIMERYKAEKNDSGFNLRHFVLTNFKLPPSYTSHFHSDTSVSVAKHINKLWSVLTRQPRDTTQYSSLISLPHPYVVPGGRFREMYYWDSYFTMLGLAQSGKTKLLGDMLDDFAYLIKKYGFIPNGTRTYYLDRSQPPFFSLMVQLYAKVKNDKQVLVHYLPEMEKEYHFWMNGDDSLHKDFSAYRNVVLLRGNVILNRYWSDQARPRPESFREDSSLAATSGRNPAKLYRNLRAAAESGWDFSSRWFKDGKSLVTIQTTQIIPVDLNSLMVHMEKTLAEAWKIKGNEKKAAFYRERAKKRRKWIQKYCWNKKKHYFSDYNFVQQKSTGVISLAGMYPLFFHVASDSQAVSTVSALKKHLLKPGGAVTTTNDTGQQWDAPNGWAPLEWITYKGLINYHFDRLARTIRSRWMRLNQKVFHHTGKMMEKYNVSDLSEKAGGGEYKTQDGFGWTNGVYLQLKSAH